LGTAGHIMPPIASVNVLGARRKRLGN